CHWNLAANDAVVEIVVELLRRLIRLDARQARGEVIDHIVAAQFAVGDDVDTCDFLILDGGFYGDIVDFIEVLPADAPGEELGFEPLQPAWHGIASDDGG